MKQKIYNKKCPFCGKEISSLSRKQMEFNYYSHVGSCKEKYMKSQANAKSNQNSSTNFFQSGGLKTTTSNGVDHAQKEEGR